MPANRLPWVSYVPSVLSFVGPLSKFLALRLRFWKRQSMTDPSLDISAALREAQLQRLEASLASKSVVKYQPQDEAPKDRDEPVRD